MKVFKAFTKLFETPQRSVKIKILVNFFSSSGIRTGRANHYFNALFKLLVNQASSQVTHWSIQIISKEQKQPSKDVLRKKCSENMQQIYRWKPMPKCGFNKVALQFYWNHISSWVFSCKFAAYYQNTLSEEPPGWLLLKQQLFWWSHVSRLCFQQQDIQHRYKSEPRYKSP